MIFYSFVFLYADPGAGALILQMLMAAAFGSLFFIRGARDRVLGFFRKTKDDNSADNNPDSSEQ